MRSLNYLIEKHTRKNKNKTTGQHKWSPNLFLFILKLILDQPIPLIFSIFELTRYGTLGVIMPAKKVFPVSRYVTRFVHNELHHFVIFWVNLIKILAQKHV